MDHEHPVVGWLGVVAIVAAIVAIAWVGVEVHGTQRLEAVLADAEPQQAPEADRVDEAVAASRWAAGFSH